MANGSGTKEIRGSSRRRRMSEYQMWIDEGADPPAIVCQVGGTQLKYQKRAIDDLHAMLKKHGDWMQLGGADEQKPAAEGTVEAWGRSENNPVGGWYGMKKGLRGRFGVYMPPLMEALGLVELTTTPRTTGCAPSSRRKQVSNRVSGVRRSRAAEARGPTAEMNLSVPASPE